MTRRQIAFGLLCAASVLVAVVYTGLVVHQRRQAKPDQQQAPIVAVIPSVPGSTPHPTPTDTSAGAGKQSPVEATAPAKAKQSERYILYRSTSLAQNYGKLVALPIDRRPSQPSVFVSLTCERVHFAAGRGVCLTADRGMITKYAAVLLNETFERQRTLPLSGPPSRVRMSPDGRRAAITVFVSGHSYSQPGFSTQTTIIDMGTGNSLGDLEQFAISRDGTRFQEIDFNFWGVTFAQNSDTFYATLASGGKKYLIKGLVSQRQGTVLRNNVECPSLSPDETRIVFKSPIGPAGRWRLHMLDLALGKETELSETRNVDDQVEWLDSSHILYSLPDNDEVSSAQMNIFILKVDDGSPPRLFLKDAYSPAVVFSDTIKGTGGEVTF